MVKKNKRLLRFGNKKGWLRIVEAFIAIMIIISAVVVVISKQNSAPKISENIYERQNQILQYVGKNNELREKVLMNDSDGIETAISTMVPSSWNYTLSICPLTDICNGKIPIDKEIYTSEILITSNETYYSPRKLRFFVWMK